MHSKLSATATLDQPSWDTIDRLVEQVEIRWRQGQWTNLAELNLPESGVLRERVLVELIKVDQDFRLRVGEPKRLEEYLREWPELAANSAIASELLTTECVTRMERGTIPTRAELQARFPELGDAIESLDMEILTKPSSIARGRRFDPAVVTSLVGQPFGRYEIRELLGRGGMGTVYRAMDRQLGREVALKVPRAELIDDPVVLERFLREAQAAAGVRHPHVCPIYDIGEFEGTYYLSMALVEGESLAALLQRGPLPPDQATELVRKLANALTKVHLAGVVHRDIKPANVMIDEAGEPLLMDFGLARLAEFQTRELLSGRSVAPDSTAASQPLSSCSRLGTPAYMSLEQAGNDPQSVDARSDLYSLGVVLYQMLTGQLPFDGTVPNILRKTAESVSPASIPVSPNLDPNLAAVVRKAMARRREDRFQTASEFDAALDAWRNAQRKGWAQAAARFANSLPRARTSMLLMALGVVLLTVLFQVLSDKGLFESERLAGNPPADKQKNGPPTRLIDQPADTQAVPVKAPFSSEQATAAQQVWANRLGVDVEITNSIGMKLRLVPPGEFTMGSAEEEIEAALKNAPKWNEHNIHSEGPARNVVIDQAFYLGTCEVTVGQFREFVTKSNYQTWAERPGNAGRVFDRQLRRLARRPGFLWNNTFVAPTEDHPVVLIHREDAEAFCEYLSRAENAVYGLPTEEQWEFACRAGSIAPWFWGEDESKIHTFAWFGDPRNASRQMPVGQKSPNAFGLYDMAGNVSEMAIGSHNAIVMRSGNAGSDPPQLRSAARELPDHNDPTYRSGFRVLRKLALTEPP